MSSRLDAATDPRAYEPRSFAPEVSSQKRPRSTRKFAIPAYSYDEWSTFVPSSLRDQLVVDESCLALDRAVTIGSLDPGSVSFGWGVAQVAPIVPLANSSDLPIAPLLSNGKWVRVVEASRQKNVGLGHAETKFLPYAIRIVHWYFESMVESRASLTKEVAVRTAVQTVFANIIREFERCNVTQVVVEQQLGQQNIMTTCLAHVFQALVAWSHPEWDFFFLAPQLTVPLFVSMLHLTPDDYPFDKSRIGDLKVKQEKKYASGLCASLVLTAQGALHPSCETSRTWASVPRDPDPKYDDISDQFWNVVAHINKQHKLSRPKKTPRRK